MLSWLHKLSVFRKAVADAKCKSLSRDLARMILRAINLNADKSKSLWSSGPVWLAIIWPDLYPNADFKGNRLCLQSA